MIKMFTKYFYGWKQMNEGWINELKTRFIKLFLLMQRNKKLQIFYSKKFHKYLICDINLMVMTAVCYLFMKYNNLCIC